MDSVAKLTGKPIKATQSPLATRLITQTDGQQRRDRLSPISQINLGKLFSSKLNAQPRCLKPHRHVKLDQIETCLAFYLAGRKFVGFFYGFAFFGRPAKFERVFEL